MNKTEAAKQRQSKPLQKKTQAKNLDVSTGSTTEPILATRQSQPEFMPAKKTLPKENTENLKVAC